MGVYHIGIILATPVAVVDEQNHYGFPFRIASETCAVAV